MNKLMKDTPLVLREGVTLDDAIRALEKNGSGYLAIVNGENRLVGILTDADIRRAVLNREFELLKVINRKPKVLPQGSSTQKIINVMRKQRKRQMPIVGPQGYYCGTFNLDEMEFNSKPNWVVIMAGGLGSRMGDLTKQIPKPMLKVHGKPVLQRIIEHYTEHGFINFIISVNYKKEIIKDYFKDGADFGVTIEYVEETQRLGTAGALSLINKSLNEPFLVTNGDVLAQVNHEDLLSWHLEQESAASMCVREHRHKIQYGIVEFDEDKTISELREKPELVTYVNAGIYVISPEVMRFVPRNQFFDMPSLFEILIEKGYSTKAYMIDDYWIDIGLRDQYVQANKDFISRGQSDVPA